MIMQYPFQTSTILPLYAVFLNCYSSAFLHKSTYSSSSSSTTHKDNQLHAGEFGELSVSEPPVLSSTLIQSAEVLLPWEQDGSSDCCDESSWKNGENWYQTRIALTNLWILPRDMSNGAWEELTTAASKGEQKILLKVPQLIRLPSSQIEASAKTILKDLNLPPALLRREPILLSMREERLKGGYESLSCSASSKKGQKKVKEECRDSPGLLVNAAIEWRAKEEQL